MMPVNDETMKYLYLLLGVLTINEIKEVYGDDSEGLPGLSIEND